MSDQNPIDICMVNSCRLGGQGCCWGYKLLLCATQRTCRSSRSWIELCARCVRAKPSCQSEWKYCWWVQRNILIIRIYCSKIEWKICEYTYSSMVAMFAKLAALFLPFRTNLQTMYFACSLQFSLYFRLVGYRSWSHQSQLGHPRVLCTWMQQPNPFDRRHIVARWANGIEGICLHQSWRSRWPKRMHVHSNQHRSDILRARGNYFFTISLLRPIRSHWQQ